MVYETMCRRECSRRLGIKHSSGGCFTVPFERYFLDTSEDSMYFENLEEAAEYVEDMVGHKVEADMNSIQQASKL